MNDLPFHVAPILGFRVWNEEDEKLLSLSYKIWPSRKPLRADTCEHFPDFHKIKCCGKPWY
ncbi:MAG: hypothetical protein ACRD2L_01215, partial [Terriglobia bacterium]